MNEAIKLAIEKGGYEDKVTHADPYPIQSKIVPNDPLFWQALGKALGKENSSFWRTKAELSRLWWLEIALRYHELVLTGGDTEKFWKGLLTSQQ